MHSVYFKYAGISFDSLADEIFSTNIRMADKIEVRRIRPIWLYEFFSSSFFFYFFISSFGCCGKEPSTRGTDAHNGDGHS